MKNKDILVIEDDKAITRVLELEFKHEGYTYDIAFDGKDGLEKFQSATYSVILLDLMLPEISGNRGVQNNPQEFQHSNYHANRTARYH